MNNKHIYTDHTVSLYLSLCLIHTQAHTHIYVSTHTVDYSTVIKKKGILCLIITLMSLEICLGRCQRNSRWQLTSGDWPTRNKTLMSDSWTGKIPRASATENFLLVLCLLHAYHCHFSLVSVLVWVGVEKSSLPLVRNNHLLEISLSTGVFFFFWPVIIIKMMSS